MMFLTGFAALAVMPLLSVAARDLDGVGLYPLVAGSFVAASLLGGVLGGAWADRSGARRPLTAGVILTVATLLVSATSTTIWQLVLGASPMGSRRAWLRCPSTRPSGSPTRITCAPAPWPS